MVASILVSLGLPVYDADSAAKRLYDEDADLMAKVVTVFGDGILAPSGKLDRSALGRRIFGDEMALERLNALVHPAVQQDFIQWSEKQFASGCRVVFRESAILFESGSDIDCHQVWMVDAPLGLRKERVQKRNGWSADEIEQRLEHQWSADLLRSKADKVIVNDGNTALVPQVVKITRELW